MKEVQVVSEGLRLNVSLHLQPDSPEYTYIPVLPSHIRIQSRRSQHIGHSD